MKERCDASIETVGSMHHLIESKGLNRHVKVKAGGNGGGGSQYLSTAVPCFPLSDFHVPLTGGPLRRRDGDDNGALWVAFGVFKHSLLCVINNLREQHRLLPEGVLSTVVFCSNGTAG